MAQGRVDQITYPGALQDHDRRIKILERVKQDDGACVDPSDWSDYGDTTVFIEHASSPGTCGTVATETADWNVKGKVWACGQPDASMAATLVEGRVIITAHTGGGFDAGEFDLSGCPGGGVPGGPFDFCYAFVPSFWQASECLEQFNHTPFGFGVYRQAATNTVLPAFLIPNPINEKGGWSVLIPGTETFDTGVAANTARPPTDTLSGYPIAWAPGDTLFDGSFHYFVEVCD